MSARRTIAREPSCWPTPITTDAKGARRTTARRDHWTSNDGESLTDAVWLDSPEDWGQPLNPDWVEAMMGFPPGWTRIDGPLFGDAPPDSASAEPCEAAPTDVSDSMPSETP